ncbi:MAG: hypothetical protein ACRD1J_04950 [Terriglobia bacterium]
MVEDNVPSIQETVDRILDGYIQRHAEFEPTVELLRRYFGKLSSDEQKRMFDRLWEKFLHALDKTRKPSKTTGLRPDICPVVIRACAVFGPTDELPFHLFAPFGSNGDEIFEVWARHVYPQLIVSLSECEGRFSQATLDTIKACCAQVISGKAIHPSSPVYEEDNAPKSSSLPKAILEAVKGLERIIEDIEFKRFARTLERQDRRAVTEKDELLILAGDLEIDATVLAALKRAEILLQDTGPFDPKSAADLLRSAIDSEHRGIVRSLEQRTGKPYEGGDRDGARRTYMRTLGFISEPEEQFFSAIYTLISKEASHKLITPKETVLVMHQTVCDYLLLLLRRLSQWKAS